MHVFVQKVHKSSATLGTEPRTITHALMHTRTTFDARFFTGPPRYHSLCTSSDDPRGFAIIIYKLNEEYAKKLKTIASNLYEGQWLRQEKGRMGAIEFLMPRLMALFSVEKGLKYKFSNNTIEAHLASEVDGMKELFDVANFLRDEDEDAFKAVLVNMYRDPEHGVDYHSDKDVQPTEKSGVVAFSTGGTRVMSFVANKDTVGLVPKTNISISSDEVYIMYGQKFQANFKHACLKLRKRDMKNADMQEARVSFTFRSLEQRKRKREDTDAV